MKTRKKNSLLFLVLPVRRQSPQPQRLQLDETRSVLLVVGARVILERSDLVIIERVRALAPDDRDVALVELDADCPLDELLRRVDRGLERLTLGGEPEAVVDELGVAGHELVLEVGLGGKKGCLEKVEEEEKKRERKESE